MNELPTRIKKQTAKFLPIETEGITLYPVTVDDLEEFRPCVPALEFMRQSLPVALLQMPLLNAFYQLEMISSERREADRKAVSLFSDTLYALCLALRLGRCMDRNEVLATRVRLLPEKDHPENIERIFFIADDGDIYTITPRQYERIRPVLCAQNGVKLYAENENPELIYAERVLRAAKAPKLEDDPAKMVAWCAALCHAEESEIYGWPLLKFLNRCEVLQRSMDYVIFGIGAASGFVKYENGSPVPSPIFAKKESTADRLLTEGSAAADAAVRSGMENARSDQTNPTRKD